MPKVTGQDLRLQIQELNALRRLPKVDTKNPKEVEQRVNDYFQFCADHEKRPTVEGLALALHTTRQTLFNWENKQDERGEIIRMAKSMLNALLIDWSMTGALNPVTMIFLSKNNFQYRDSVQVEAMRIGEESLPSRETIIADLQETIASENRELLTKEQIIASLPTNE